MQCVERFNISLFPHCLTRPNAECTFAGFPCAQTWNDLALWEAFLDSHPIYSILELGTWRGGMALFLAFQCKARGASFVTIDHDGGLLGCREQLTFLDAQIEVMDLFGAGAKERIGEISEALTKPTLLFCDNGNKVAEWREFVPLLSPGDFVAVHDWGSEFHEENAVGPVKSLMRAECEAIDSITRFFQVDEAQP